MPGVGAGHAISRRLSGLQPVPQLEGSSQEGKVKVTCEPTGMH